MTRRKDLQPESDLPKDDPVLAEAATPEPFVIADPVAPLPPEPPPVRPTAAQQVIVRRGSVLAPLLGGALAAIGGFALSHFNVLDLRTEDAAILGQIQDASAQQVAAQEKLGKDIAVLAGRIETLESRPESTAPDLSRLDAIDQRLAEIEAMPTDGSASTAALTAKLADLEKRLSVLPSSATDPALQQKLDDALTRLSEAEASAAARATEAEAAAAAAVRSTAIDDLSAAIATGQPFAAELQAIADPSLANALGAVAETGVPTLAALQASFPDAARNALVIARDLSTEDGWGGRLVDFLASQTGARPLTPLEGDTADAVLSRSEFALSEGRVADALAELQSLDPAVIAPFADWTALAQVHLAAADALQAARGQ